MISDATKRWLDGLGISLMLVLLLLAYLIRIYPEAVMDPGFPILREKSIKSYANMDGIPYRATSIYDTEKVKYINQFALRDARQPDTAFGIVHELTRYENPAAARLAFETAAEHYRPGAAYRVVTIPGLDFSSQADKYWLWCEQFSEKEQPKYPGELVEICYYWAVYGPYYSVLWMYFDNHAGGERYFSVDIFTELVARADQKLSTAP